jgi:hypothetical protein
LDEREMKLFGLVRDHKPDKGALSALVDGALDTQAAAELEAHVAGCAACAAELEGMRRVKSMLAALPQVAPARSFRVRAADVEERATPQMTPSTGLLRAMPILAATAAIVFVATLATDFSTRDSNSGRQATVAPLANGAAERSSAMEPASADQGEDSFSAEATKQYYSATPSAPAGAIAADSSDVPADSAGREAQPGTAADNAEGGQPAPVPSRQAGSPETVSTGDDDDGNRTGYLIVEVVAGAAAFGALALFVINRRRSEGKA